MEKDVLNFKVWHQSFAHCSEKRLRLTQKHVDGIPHFHNATIPHIVKHPAALQPSIRPLWKKAKYFTWILVLSGVPPILRKSWLGPKMRNQKS